MSIAWSLFALSLLGAEAPSNREASPAEISYDVRVVKLDGLAWRGAFFARLQPVATQSGQSVWTASHETAAAIAALDPNAQKWPRMTGLSRAVVHGSHRASHRLASGLSRLADGPFDHATQVAYTPRYEDVREGCTFTLSGRKLDQGVLACVVLDDTHVTTVHHVKLVESVAAKACCDQEASGCCAEKSGTVASRIEIPEVAHASVAGEWLIPNDGTLVLSLGVQTISDADGKAVAVERLVLIEAKSADPALKQTSVPDSSFPTLPDPPPYIKDDIRYLDVTPEGKVVDRPEPARTHSAIPMPMPTMPSRSLPVPLAADGTLVPLPPLPNEPPPTTLPDSSDPAASPQGQKRVKERPEPSGLDPASATASFAPGRTEAAAAPSTTLFRLPLDLNGGTYKIHIEIQTSNN